MTTYSQLYRLKKWPESLHGLGLTNNMVKQYENENKQYGYYPPASLLFSM